MEEKKPVLRRPRAVSSPEEFDRRVDEYVDSCIEKKEPILLTGLILALGLTSKEGFYHYQTYPEFGDSVKRARLLVEYEYEKRLNGGSRPTGPIFALKNMGWRDNQQVDHVSTDGSMTPKESVPMDAAMIKAIAEKLNDEC